MAGDNNSDAKFRDLETSLRNLHRSVRSAEQSIHSAESHLERSVNEVSDRVDTAIRISRGLQTDLQAIRETFESFIQEERLARNEQIAQTRLIDVRNEITRQFGPRETVRRNTKGMLQAMDARIVTQRALQEAAEELMLDVPEYWLAPVLVALAAWIRNDRRVADYALVNAVSRDRDKTALFFSLVLARYKRFPAVADWISEYLDEQHEDKLSREFTVVLDAVTQGALGPDALRKIRDRCDSWIAGLSPGGPAVEEQKIRWGQFIDRQRTQLGDDFSILPTVCTNWPDVLNWLESATVHAGTERKLRAWLAETTVRYSDLRQAVDSILDTLVAKYDRDEEPLRLIEARMMAIIKHHGNHTLADETLAAEATDPESRINFLALLTDIGLRVRGVTASSLTRQFSIAMASDWIEASAHELTEKSRSHRPEEISVNINSWQYGLRPASTDEEPISLYNAHIDQWVSLNIQHINLRRQTTVLTASVAIIIGTLLTLLLGWFPATFSLILLAGAGIFLLTACLDYFRSRRRLPVRKDNMQIWGAQQKEDGTRKIQATLSEIRELFRKWDSEIAQENSLIDFIQSERNRVSQEKIEIETTAAGSPAIDETRTGGQDRAVVPDTEPPAHVTAENTLSQTMALSLPEWDLRPPGRRGALSG